MSRPYTGWDGDAKGRRAGTEKFVQIVCFLAGNKLWNNGTWGVRNARGKQSPSIHGTGRAADLSWRIVKERGRGGSYVDARKMIDFLVEWADVLGIEYVADYNPAPGGEAWRCDRDAWKKYEAGKIHGAPGGDWFHIELSPAHADDPGFYDQQFKAIFAGTAKKPSTQAASTKQTTIAPVSKPTSSYPGASIKVRSKDSESVKRIQQALGIVVDGKFGAQTKSAVEAAQVKAGLGVTGVVDEATWKAIVG